MSEVTLDRTTFDDLPFAPQPQVNGADFMDTEPLVEIVNLQKQLSDKIAAAILNAKKRFDIAVSELKALGVDPFAQKKPVVAAPKKTQAATAAPAVAKVAATRVVKAKGKRGSKPDKDLTCPHCDVAGHSGRAHRFQAKKKAFNAEQLARIARGESPRMD